MARLLRRIERHRWNVRWTGVLAGELGSEFRVVEEGQSGRTTVHEDPIALHRNGRVYLPACLESHNPIDLVVLMLGTNDLKAAFHLPPGEIASGAEALVKLIQQSPAGRRGKAPKVLLVCPPEVGDMAHLPDLAEKFPDAAARSRRFPDYYEAVAARTGCAYFNSQGIMEPSPVDGLHSRLKNTLNWARHWFCDSKDLVLRDHPRGAGAGERGESGVFLSHCSEL